MHRLPLALIVLLTCSSLVACRSDESDGVGRVDRMTEQLQLSPEQAEEVRALFEAHRVERERVRARFAQRTPETRSEMEAARDSLRASLDERIIAVLTEEQATQYRELIQRRRRG
ncbi:MAG: hypothetical protein R3362_01840 [Rhodothermales bacterium]|nr:hypothetical protein [Rhodothermales bacterium]